MLMHEKKKLFDMFIRVERVYLKQATKYTFLYQCESHNLKLMLRLIKILPTLDIHYFMQIGKAVT